MKGHETIVIEDDSEVEDVLQDEQADRQKAPLIRAREKVRRALMSTSGQQERTDEAAPRSLYVVWFGKVCV